MSNNCDNLLADALSRIPAKERAAWLGEIERLTRLVESYKGINPKRRFNDGNNSYEFVPKVLSLCQQAMCLNQSL